MDEVRYSEALSLHPLNETDLRLFLLPFRALRPHFGVDDVGQLRPFHLFELDLPLRNLFGDFAAPAHFVLRHHFLEVFPLLRLFLLFLIGFDLFLSQSADSAEDVGVDSNRL